MHAGEHVRAAPKILRESDHLPAAALDALAVGAEDVVVGMTESVDRLVDIADDKGRWPPLAVGVEQTLDQSHLQGIGVLELVDQHVLEFQARPGRHIEEVGRPLQDVVEIHAAGGALGGLERIQHATDGRAQPLARTQVRG